MAMTFVNISTYLVFAYGGPNGNAGVAASISLGIPNAFAFLNFYPPGAALPANHVETLSGTPTFYVSYHYEQLANVIDVLRNEKPLKFFFNDANLIAYVTTGKEPVGEGES